MSEIGQDSIFETGMEKRRANYTPLSPVSLIRRTALVFPEMPAIAFKDKVYNWAKTFDRCVRLANAIAVLGIQKNVTVSVLAQNIPASVHSGT